LQVTFTYTAGGHADAPWQWGTCFGGVNIPIYAVLQLLCEEEQSMRAALEHYFLLHLLVGAGSGMGGLA
jgi:hypothetical protein